MSEKINHFFKKRKIKEISTMADDVAEILTDKKGGDKNLSASDREIKRDLVDVYTDDNGKIPDMSKLDNTTRPLWKTLTYYLIGFFTLVIIIGVAGFLFFANRTEDKFTNERISLKIEPPLTLVSGQEMEYTITVTNGEELNLYNTELNLTYPDNFEFVSSEPAALGEKNNFWQFSVLKVGETKTITLRGKIVAALSSRQTFKGVLSFKPANINATFKQESIVDVAVAQSILSLQINGPENILANQKVDYTLTYQNNSDIDLKDVQIVVDYPQGFLPSQLEPDPEKGQNNIWKLSKLNATSSGQIKISGDYGTIDENANRDFKAQIQLKLGSDYYPQAETSVVTGVVKDQLNLQLIINGSGEDQPINFNDTLTYSLMYKNTGQEELKDIQLTAYLNSQILDLASLKDDNRGIKKNNTITWTGREIPKLLKLGAGAEGQINFTVRVKDSTIVTDDKITKFNVESYVEGKSSQASKSGSSIVKTKTIVNAINSNLTLTAAARYYNEDNVALGSGPIQPSAGEKSTYNIKINLANNLNDIKDITLTAALPKNVEWANKENHIAGDLIYDKQSNKITWNISRLAKSAGQTELNFNVAIKPTNDDFGRVLILVSEINLTAQDANTGAAISNSLRAITTALQDPILGETAGTVK